MIELQSQSTPEGEAPMSPDEIYDHILGTRLGYVKGLGDGPKSTTSSTSKRILELEEALQRTQKEADRVQNELREEIQTYRSKLEDITTQIVAILAY